jgi:hypothetical protein
MATLPLTTDRRSSCLSLRNFRLLHLICCLIAVSSLLNPISTISAGDQIPAGLQKTFEQNTVVVTVTAGDASQSGSGAVVAPGQVLTALSLVNPNPVPAEKDGKLDALDATLAVTVRAASPEAKPLKAKITWFSVTENIALLKIEGTPGTPLRLELKTAVKEKDAVFTLARAGADVPPVPSAGILALAEAPGRLALDFGNAACIDGAPVFNQKGQWVGSVSLATPHPQLADAIHLAGCLYGTIRKITTLPADFDPDAGGKLTVQVEVAAALAPPRTITVQTSAAPAAAPVALRFNAKLGCYEGTVTVAPTPGVADQPVDESKLPNTVPMHYRMDPNSMVGKQNQATVSTNFIGDFLTKYIEVTTPDNVSHKIYYTAMFHATFAPDGTATVLTTDRRTITGRLTSRFTYQVGTMKWTCGAEQITYLETPDAKPYDKKSPLTLKIAGTGADGTALPPTETVLK